MARCKGPDRWTYSLYVSISSKLDEHSETGLSKTCAGTSAMAVSLRRLTRLEKRFSAFHAP
jgi:hypothetical protein